MKGRRVDAVETRRRRPPLWVLYLVAAGAGIATYYLAAVMGSWRDPVRFLVYCGTALAALVALVVGPIRNHSPHRLPWVLLGCGQLLSTCADVASAIGWSTDVQWMRAPNITDAMYLATYPILTIALMLVIRRRTPGWDGASMIDAGIIAVSAGLLCWVYLVTGLAGDAGPSPLARGVAAAYPLADLMLLVACARLMLGAGTRTVSFAFLNLYVAFLLVTDLAYMIEALLRTFHPGSFVDAGWMLSVTFLGAAALHPSMARISDRSPVAAPDATPGRLLVLAVASLLAPSTLLVQYLTGNDLHVPLVVAACIALFSLVMVRMAALVRTQRMAAITDGLTGLRTRRFFEESLRRESARAKRGAHGFAVLLLDVDHFKLINDTYGHHGGDRVLCELSSRLVSLVRSGDLVARYGGEEFAVLLPDTTPAVAADLAERVRRAIANLPMSVGERTLATVTVSVGVACLPEHCESADELTLMADHALYAAKASGRNQVVSGARVPSPREPVDASPRSEPVTGTS